MIEIRTKRICAGCYRYQLVADGAIVDTCHVERGLEPGPSYWTTSIHDGAFTSKAEAKEAAIYAMEESYRLWG